MQLPKIEKRKGISPLIATLLLIAIAVAASVLTYSWVMSMIGSQSAQAQTQLRIDTVSFNYNGTSNTVAVLVRNTGSTSATIESIAVRANSAGTSLVYDSDDVGALDVGAKANFRWGESTPLLTAGQSFVIRVTATTGFYYESVYVVPN